MVKALFNLLRALFSYIELIAIAFLINFATESATAITIFIILFLCNFKWSSQTRAIGWFLGIFLYLSSTTNMIFLIVLLLAVVGGLFRWGMSLLIIQIKK
ncbi:hypothetical protein [Risungbinella massiliensis]|uniref:hypothetical protein n=1 Tax=Risungbinella massiliensis TaxID=1329796 RepID=UPI0005CC0FD1|nr:hypothetical protein [Risungbinella massiliensis]